MIEFLLFLHVFLGVGGVIAAVWSFVELLNTSELNLKRIKIASLWTALFFWASYLFGGYWYVVYYAADKAIINAGQWPWAHSFSMEVKEHLFFLGLLMATMLPVIIAKSPIVQDKKIRRMVQFIVIFIILVGIAMEGFGALTSFGVRVGLTGGK